MTKSKTLFLLAGAALSMGATAALADDTSVSRDEVRAIVSEMMQDAETRSSLLQGGVTGGHDGKFFLASSNGDFRLNIGGFTQFRYIMNFRDNNSTDNSFEPGFQMARTRLEFGGHVVNPNLKFFISAEFSANDSDNNSTGNFSLKDAYMNYSFGNGWGLWAGQGKIPFLKEELISDTKQLAVDRGFVNGAFTLGRSQGVGLSYVGEGWSMHNMFSDGPNADNTNYSNGSLNGTNTAESDYSFGTRFEFKLAGKDLNEFTEFTSKPDSDFACLLGIAGNHSQSPNTSNPADTDVTYSTVTADLTLKSAGLSFFIAGVAGFTESRAAGTDTDLSDYGVVAQLGYRFGNIEPFVRYDGIFYDSDRGLEEDTNNFFTVGVNDYLAGQAAKLTVDAVFVSGDASLVGVAPGISGTGFANSQNLLPGGGDDEIAIRAQFQLMF